MTSTKKFRRMGIMDISNLRRALIDIFNILLENGFFLDTVRKVGFDLKIKRNSPKLERLIEKIYLRGKTKMVCSKY